MPELLQLLALFPAADQQLLLASCARLLLLLRLAAGWSSSGGRLGQLAAAVRQLQMDSTESSLLELIAMFDTGQTGTVTELQ